MFLRTAKLFEYQSQSLRLFGRFYGNALAMHAKGDLYRNRSSGGEHGVCLDPGLSFWMRVLVHVYVHISLLLTQ